MWSARSTFQRHPRALAVDADGSIYVAGDTSPSLLPVGTFLLKYGPNGSQLWYTNLPSVLFRQLGLSDAGELYVSVGTFTDSALVETRQFVQTPAPSQLIATIVPALTEAFPGSDVTLTAVVMGAGPFTYQWRHFGYLTGGTNATFTVPNVQYEWRSQGDYTVVVSNATGYTISPEARITILRRPVIQFQPVDQYVSIGQQATFRALANGTEPFSFQWHFNDSPIPDVSSCKVRWGKA